MIEIIDLSNMPLSDRNGSYGGLAGLKDGIIYNNEYWIVKYPKNTGSMRNVDISYTTAPLSEFIGSHIYNFLGIDAHETILGFRKNKIVVACRDFCETEGALREIRTIKNYANEYLSEILERDFKGTGSSDTTIDLEETLLHLKYNDILTGIDGIKERFWNSVVVDALINNNDRNNGNWGILKTYNGYVLAPVFDNGASFSNKISEEKIHDMLQNKDKLIQSSIGTVTIYSKNDKAYTTKKLFNAGFEDLDKAILRLVPKIREKFPEIINFINDIPNTYNGIPVCSEERKEFYIKGMEYRFQYIIEERYKQISSSSGNSNNLFYLDDFDL